MKINRIASGLMAVLLLLCACLPAATAQDVSAQLTEGPWEMTMPGYGASAYMTFLEDGTGTWYIGDWMYISFLWSVYDCVYQDGTVDTRIAISFIDEEGVYQWGYMNMPYQDNSYLITNSRTGLSLQDINHSGYDLAGHSAQKSINLVRVSEIPYELYGWFNASSDQTGIICRDRIYPCKSSVGGVLSRNLGISCPVRYLYRVVDEVIEFETKVVTFAVIFFHNAFSVGKTSGQFIAQILCAAIDT